MIKIGIFGTGDVGKTLGAALALRGHDVMLGTRDVAKKMAEKAAEGSISFRDWQSKNKKIRLGTFAEAGAHGEVLMNATAGHGSLDALSRLKSAEVSDKILIDVSNALGPWG